MCITRGCLRIFIVFSVGRVSLFTFIYHHMPWGNWRFRLLSQLAQWYVNIMTMTRQLEIDIMVHYTASWSRYIMLERDKMKVYMVGIVGAPEQAEYSCSTHAYLMHSNIYVSRQSSSLSASCIIISEAAAALLSACRIIHPGNLLL